MITDTMRTPTARAASRQRRLHRAFVVELRLNRDRFAATLFVCAISVILAALWTDDVAELLPIWAALAWYRYGRADTAGREELRACLGMSRSERVHGRIALITLESVLVIVVMSGANLLAASLGNDAIGTGPTATLSTAPWTSSAVTTLLAGAYTAAVLVATGLWVGEDCVTRRPGRSMAVLSVLICLLAGLLGTFAVILAVVPLSMSGLSPLLGAVIALGSVIVLVVLLALLLRARMHAWIRQLDSGVRQRLEPIA